MPRESRTVHSLQYPGNVNAKKESRIFVARSAEKNSIIINRKAREFNFFLHLSTCDKWRKKFSYTFKRCLQNIFYAWKIRGTYILLYSQKLGLSKILIRDSRALHSRLEKLGLISGCVQFLLFSDIKNCLSRVLPRRIFVLFGQGQVRQLNYYLFIINYMYTTHLYYLIINRQPHVQPHRYGCGCNTHHYGKCVCV